MRHKKITKIIISLFLLFIFSLFFQNSFGKYVISNTLLVAKLDIDRCKPNIELLDIVSSNEGYPTYANKTHTITGHLKVTEKNIVKNNLSSNSLQVSIANKNVSPEFKNFFLVSQNANQKIYEFSFTNTTGDGSLILIIPEGTIEDKSGLTNEAKYLFTGIHIDNTPPSATFLESLCTTRKIKSRDNNERNH